MKSIPFRSLTAVIVLSLIGLALNHMGMEHTDTEVRDAMIGVSCIQSRTTTATLCWPPQLGKLRFTMHSRLLQPPSGAVIGIPPLAYPLSPNLWTAYLLNSRHSKTTVSLVTEGSNTAGPTRLRPKSLIRPSALGYPS